VVAALLFFGAWQLLYPDPGDPKGMRYVLWKAGIWPMDLDLAADTMIGDRNRDAIVIGKTKEQLSDRFGFLLPPSATASELQRCYRNSNWKAQSDVLFIRHSRWMVVFRQHKAADMVLAKGC
jgi:hypothetical protein